MQAPVDVGIEGHVSPTASSASVESPPDPMPCLDMQRVPSVADLCSSPLVPQRRSASDLEPAGDEPGTTGRRKRHILSEQRRRNQIRKGFKDLSDLLDLGRLYGARALGLNAGAGTGVEDEELDDRTDTEEDLILGCDQEEVQRRKRNAQRRSRNRNKQNRGRGRGRGGSAGGAGSKSAVLFQVIDLLDWLEGRNNALEQEIAQLEALAQADAPPEHAYRHL
ncbi:hypothetical protein MNAN1_000461 [Malassezia nana]|uniref:BHLH domain-containing protein n=1 Tax=Malassezia nana TaxID=180528 RepID=A0AAF0EML9_9BASI|nr:hypothetical protein MNAN1_000461 [Malassezia nana]